METFADYILSEEEYTRKIEIAYYLSKKERLYFDKSVVFKTELARLFIDTMKIDVDKNLVLTACLLYSCKKTTNPLDLANIDEYVYNGVEYLENLGFNDYLCNVCKQVNRNTSPIDRTKEGDVLELVDNFGEMLLDKENSKGFSIDEAIILLKHKNFKGQSNQYLEQFMQFVNLEEGVTI